MIQKISKNWTKGSAGQVSIFLVFLFQILFIFFAMVVNVGLLVYYKINLQNSVDLSAYYGAMKQAEMLNTIGHINYQIRQSWKLLAYRSLILGSLGPNVHPARPVTAGSDNFKPPPTEIIYADDKGEPVLPVFCITISDIYVNLIGIGEDAVKKINKDDNQCKKFKGLPLSGFKIPDVIWALPGTNQKIRDGAIALQDKFLEEFSGGAVRNYLTQAYFIYLFRADSMNRRKVLSVLANAISKNIADFPDIEGKSVSEGSAKVLAKNLAEQNNTNDLHFNFYNSLANSGCGGANSDTEELPGWLKEIDVLTDFPYMDSEINDDALDGPEKAGQTLRYIGRKPEEAIPSSVKPDSSSYPGFLIINSFLSAQGIPKHAAGRWTTTVGVEKNPWCMPYVGVKASSSPKLPFMPARFSPNLQAKAFAKPFGSQIGPWYGKSWPGRSISSTSNTDDSNRIDMRLPPRLLEGMTRKPSLPPTEQIRYLPNYSRFPGDRFGLLSQAARFAYGRFYWKTRPTKPPFWTAMWKEPSFEAINKNSEISSSFFMGPMSGDILADPYQNKFFTMATDVNQAKQFANEMRKSELAAIAPDLFDITYYSIEPRFNQFQLPNLENFVKMHNSKRPSLLVRGDFGWRSPNYPGEPNFGDINANIENEVELFKLHDFNKLTGHQIFQTITDSAQLLTSWSETSIIEYDPSLSSNKMANCLTRIPANTEPWSPGACVKGGRTGYSVKLVSKKFLSGEIPNLGGESVNGPVLNPPDPSF